MYVQRNKKKERKEARRQDDAIKSKLDVQNSNVWFSTDKFILRSNFKKNKFITNLIQFTSPTSQRGLVPFK